MAEILKTNGTKEPMDKKAQCLSLEEMQRVVDGFIEIIALHTVGKFLIINEEGKLKNLPFNALATNHFNHEFGSVDSILGDAILCDPEEVE